MRLGIAGCGNVAYDQALAAVGKAAAITPLTALYPLVTIGLALLFLRERLNLIQGAGAALSLSAMYCFNGGAGSGWLTPCLAVALLGERISGREGIGIVLAIMAAVALARESPPSETSAKQ